MIPISLKMLAHLTGGILYGNDLTVNSITTDSRNVTSDCLFIALIGKRFDAHQFVNNAVIAGSKALLVNKLMTHVTGIPQVVVHDTYLAFSQLASWVRNQSQALVLAITGSSGKTSVKEITAAILRQCGQTLCTTNNFNNHFGVPMTLLSLTKEHDYAVIEVGASHPGEIANSTALIQPKVALVNNISAAHLAGFGSLDGVAKEKGKIFTALTMDGTAIINADSNDISRWKLQISKKRLWRFSTSSSNAEFRASNILLHKDAIFFTLHTPNGDVEIELPLIGHHNIANVLAAAALSISVDASLNAIQKGIKTLKPLRGRLFPIRLASNQLLIDDSYNSNVSSLVAAIKILAKMPGLRVLTVGDMDELGDQAEKYHCQVAEIVKLENIDCVLSIGKYSHLIGKYNQMRKHFISKQELLEYLLILLSQYHTITILIKGSRSATMDRLVQSLQEKKSC